MDGSAGDNKTPLTVDPRNEASWITDYQSNSVTFVGKGNPAPSKYIIISPPPTDIQTSTNKKSISEIINYLEKESFLPTKPEVLISVTGGAQEFYMPAAKKEQVFNRGVLTAAQNSSAWIVDGGLDAGVMQYLGKATKEKAVKDVPCIGIASRKMVIMNELLEKATQPVEYVANIANNPNKCALNPNHTHFILVDSVEAKWGQEITFRSAFEKVFQDTFKIPVVLIVVNGGPVTLEIIASAVEKNFAIVVVQGSGRASDAVAALVTIAQKANLEALNIDLLMNLRDGVDISAWSNLFAGVKEDDKAKIKGYMELIIKNYKKVTIFNADEASADMDVFILRSILSKTNSLKDKLKFGVTWNREDIVAEILEKELPDGWQERGTTEGTQNGIAQESLSEALNAALQLSIALDRPKIFSILVDNGAKKNSVNLRDLYNLKDTTYFFKHLPAYGRTRGSSFYSFNDSSELAPNLPFNSLHEVLRHAGKIFAGYATTITNKKVKVGFIDILIWAVFVNRMDLAKVIWQKTTFPMHSALLSCHLYRYLSNHFPSKDEYLENAFWFENEAIKMMNIFATYKDITDIKQVVGWKWPKIGNYTAIQIAQDAKCKKFVCHTHVQSWLDDEFYSDQYGKVAATTSSVRILLAIVMPLLIYTIYYPKDPEVTYNNNHKNYSGENAVDTSKNLGSPLKILNFYRLPIVKFWTNTSFYCLFLFVQAWVLCNLDQNDHFHTSEIILCIWVGSMILEEVQQYNQGKETHFKHLSNWMDVGILFLHVVFIILRCISHEMDQENSNVQPIFLAAINTLIIATLLSWGRLLHVFAISDTLGPLYFIIIRLFKDIFVWIFVFMIFAVSFQLGFVSITKQAGADPLQTYPDGTFPVSFFTIIGDFSYAAPIVAGTPLGVTLLAVYALLAQVILVNLLIAMMGDTYSTVINNSAEEWKFYRLELMTENQSTSFHPPPINLIIVPIKILFGGNAKEKNRQPNREMRTYTNLANCILKRNPSEESLLRTKNTSQPPRPNNENASDADFSKYMRLARGKVMDAEVEAEETSVENIVTRLQDRLRTLANERENDRTFLNKKFNDLETKMAEILSRIPAITQPEDNKKWKGKEKSVREEHEGGDGASGSASSSGGNVN